jgi:release factor glutamine methyltransferase
MTIREIIQQTARRLESAGTDTARLDAEVLLAFFLNCDRTELIKNYDVQVAAEQLKAFDGLVQRRLAFEPVAYITGRKEFWSFRLEVNRDVLIPRPDTEVIVEEALSLCRRLGIRRPLVADIGTGSGAIALALAAEIPNALVTATDISAAALDVARRNASALSLEERIHFVSGDLFENVSGAFDMIVSNPPYIGSAEYETLAPGVRDFEPALALLAGQTGLEIYEKLIYQAHARLREKGWLLLEIGAKQHEPVISLMTAGGGLYEDISVRTDYAGRPRVVKGRRK